MKQKIRLTESDLHRIVKESVNRILMENEEVEYDDNLEEGEGFFSGFKDGYGNGIKRNVNNGEFTNDLATQGQGYRKGDQSQTKWNAIKNRTGMALGSLAGGRMPKNIYKGMNWGRN